MKLYIVRHGIAVPHGAPGIAEDERPLTEEGIQKMKVAAAGLKKLDVVPEMILSSPLPRAEQTAKIVQKALGPKVSLKLTRALSPAGNRTDVYKEIREQEKVEGLMLVGHQPSLGEIAGEIAWGSSDRYIELKKGGAVAIELERLSPIPGGTLLWLLTPSILRQLGS
jgi:phosphohistidine phosphatase